MHPQLPLNIRLDSEATFSNYFVAPGSPNRRVVSALQSACCADVDSAALRFIYLWGAAGSGTSHLLQAACREAAQAGRRAAYLPLGNLGTLDNPSAVLEGLEVSDLLCLDDLQAVCGQADWDRALFFLFNRLRETRSCLVVAARLAPRDLPCRLPDLASRLASGVCLHLEGLDDAGKQAALQWRAALRGLDLVDEVAAFLLRHGSREPQVLFACLDKLDKASLAEKRRLSIPLVKETLGL